MFTLPGTPVIRYGDELGMGDNLKLPERNCARTTMQWSNEPHGGFTKSDKPHIPAITGGPYGYEHINAAIQRRHPDSLLNWTERISSAYPGFGWMRCRSSFPPKVRTSASPRSSTTCSVGFANSCSGDRGTASCSGKPMCCRTPNRFSSQRGAEGRRVRHR
jgi:hypothetical protein